MPLDNRELTDLEKSSGGAGGCGLITGILTIVGIVWSIVEADIDDLLFPLKALIGLVAVAFLGWLILTIAEKIFDKTNREADKREDDKKSNEQKIEAEKLNSSVKEEVIRVRESMSWLYKKDGTHRIFHENGQIWKETNYKNNKFDGLSREYYENGQLKREQNYKDGKTVGLFKMWYENGQLESEVNFKDGKLNGLSRGYYENGQLECEQNFKDGETDGLFKMWYENGQLKCEQNFKDGKLID